MKKNILKFLILCIFASNINIISIKADNLNNSGNSQSSTSGKNTGLTPSEAVGVGIVGGALSAVTLVGIVALLIKVGSLVKNKFGSNKTRVVKFSEYSNSIKNSVP